MEVQPLLIFLLITNYFYIHHPSYQSGGDSNLRIIQIYIEEIFIVGEEYQVVNIITAKSIIDILIFLLFVFHHLNYANIFYYYAKAILPDNLSDLLQNFDLYRVLVIALISIYLVDILIGYFFTKVKSNSSDIFSGTSSQVKHEIAIFVFFIIFVVLTPPGSLVISDNINVVLDCFDSNEFDQF